GRQEVCPRARPLEGRRDANRAQGRYAHALCALRRSDVRLRVRGAGATRSGLHSLSRLGYLRDLLRYSSLDAVDRRGRVRRTRASFAAPGSLPLCGLLLAKAAFCSALASFWCLACHAL